MFGIGIFDYLKIGAGLIVGRGTRLLSGALDWPERRKANGGDGRPHKIGNASPRKERG